MKVQQFTVLGCEPIWKANQLKVSMSFLDQLLTNPPSQNDEDAYSLVLEYIHRFLVFAFASSFSENSDGGSVDSIIEQIILSTSFNLNPTEGWRAASAVINGVLKVPQYASCIVSVHSAFLGNLGRIWSEFGRILPYSGRNQ